MRGGHPKGRGRPGGIPRVFQRRPRGRLTGGGGHGRGRGGPADTSDASARGSAPRNHCANFKTSTYPEKENPVSQKVRGSGGGAGGRRGEPGGVDGGAGGVRAPRGGGGAQRGAQRTRAWGGRGAPCFHAAGRNLRGRRAPIPPKKGSREESWEGPLWQCAPGFSSELSLRDRRGSRPSPNWGGGGVFPAQAPNPHGR